nr:zinc finger, CCHC-type [Tanacetum cinerariifolium]
ITPVAIIDRQLSFEYTIASRSTDVMVMAHPVQNINHSAFRSMFKREKLSGNNFNDWFHQLKLVACLMLGSMTPELHRQFENSSPYEMLQELKSMFEKQAGVERFDLIQTFHACKQKEGKSVSQYVLKMKGDFAGFVRNYNMHNMEKTNGELHAMLIEYEKGLPKKAATPQVMAIHDEHPEKNDICHQCNEVGHWKKNFPVYLAELMKNKKQVGSANSSDDKKSFSHRPERATDLLGLIHTDVCGPLRHVSIECASYFINFTDDYSRYDYIYLHKHKHEVFETFKVFKNEVKNQLGKTIKALRSDRGGEYISQEFKDYLKACGIVQQLTPPYTPQHNGVSERSGRAGDLEEIQDEDTSPSKITSEIPMEVKEVEEHSLGDLNEPINYKAATLDPESNKWLDAMNTEMQSMKDNQCLALG